jgi:YVTN family beta-propeller protein
MLLSAACARKKGTGYPGYALIATSGDNSIAAVDLTRFQLAKIISVGAPPTAVLAGVASSHHYVLTPGNGSVHIVDANLNVIASRKLSNDIAEIRLTSDGKRLIAIAGSARELIEADPVSLSVVARHPLSDPPKQFDISSSGHIAISGGRHCSVELLDLASGRHTSAQMSGAVGQVRFRADGKLLLASNLGDRSLTAFSVPGLRVVTELPLAMQPQNLCFNADAGQLFVSGEGMDAVAIVFPYQFEVDQTVLAGRDPGVMGCSASPSYLFVASGSGSDISILDIDTRKMIGIVNVGQKPAFITVTPDDQYALVLNEQSGDMAVIHVQAIRANRSKTGASLFTMLAVGSKPVQAAIVPRTI